MDAFTAENKRRLTNTLMHLPAYSNVCAWRVHCTRVGMTKKKVTDRNVDLALIVFLLTIV